MNELLVFAAICFMVWAGFITIRIIGFLREQSFFQNLPYSFALGAGIIAMQLYVYSRFHLAWNIILLIAPWMGVTFIFLAKTKPTWKQKIPRVQSDIVDKLLFCLISVLILFVTFEAAVRPVTAWDGFASWLLRAKMFFVEGSVHPSIFSYIPSEYPLLVSLMATWVYVFLGGVDDRSVLLLYASIYFFMTILCFNSLKPFLGKTKALFFTFLLISSQNIIRHSGRYEAGQADIIQGFYLFVSSLLFLRFLKSKAWKDLVFLQIVLAITALIKNEGVPFVLLVEVFLCFFLLKEKLLSFFFAMLFFLIPFIDWQVFKATVNLPEAPSYLQNVFHGERSIVIVSEYAKELFRLQNWNFLWFSFFLSVLTHLFFSKKKKYIAVLYTIILLQLGVYISVFFLTVSNPALHVPNVADRVLLHLAPTSVFLIGVTYSLVKKDLQKITFTNKFLASFFSYLQ